MADNLAVTAGSGTTIAADDVSGVLHQRVKISLGADGAATDALGGAGSVAAGVQRVTLASDDPAVVAAQLIDDAIYVDDGDFTDSVSKFALVGGVYQAVPQSITDGDVGPMQVDVRGAQITSPHAASDNFWSYAAASGGIDNSSTAVTIRTAAGAGLRNYITSLQIAHATLGATTELAIRDGAAGTVIWRTILHTTALGTFNVQFPVPLRGTANTLLEVVTLTAVTGDVLVNAQGFVAP
jgi:hypothetical protein